MSIKEQIRSLASDNEKSRSLSAQLIHAARYGTVPTVVLEDGRRIRIVPAGAASVRTRRAKK